MSLTEKIGFQECLKRTLLTFFSLFKHYFIPKSDNWNYILHSAYSEESRLASLGEGFLLASSRKNVLHLFFFSFIYASFVLIKNLLIPGLTVDNCLMLLLILFFNNSLDT